MYYLITNSSCIYNLLISLIVTEIREGVVIRRGSVIGDFPLPIYGFTIVNNIRVEYVKYRFRITNKYLIKCKYFE